MYPYLLSSTFAVQHNDKKHIYTQNKTLFKISHFDVLFDKPLSAYVFFC